MIPVLAGLVLTVGVDGGRPVGLPTGRGLKQRCVSGHSRISVWRVVRWMAWTLDLE